MARRLISLALGLLALTYAEDAAAQLRRETEPVMLPPLSMSAPDGAFALSLNPAALTGLIGWNVAFVHGSGPNDDEAKDRGDALYGAMPLPFGFAAALSVEHRREGTPFGAATHVSLGGAYAHTPRFSAGFAVHHIQGGSVDGATTLDLAILVRRSRFFAFSLVGYDVLGPASLVGLNGLTVPTSIIGAFTVRPHGDDYLTLEGFAGAATDGRIGFGGFGSIGLPRGGRVLARTTVEHFRYQREVRVVAGAELPWDWFGAFGGVAAGEGYENELGWYVGGTAGKRPVMSLPGLTVVYDLVVGARVDARGILALVDSLQRAANDPRVGGVLLRLRDAELALAYAEELRQAIETVRAAHKPVLCQLESAGTAELYACASADRTLLDPDAVVQLEPPTVDVLSLPELFADANIDAEFVARGTGGPEAYVDDEVALRADVLARVQADLGRSLDASPAEVEALLDGRSVAAPSAVETPLADGLASDAELDDVLADAIDGRVHRRSSLGPFGPRAWSRPRRVGVVVVSGIVVDEGPVVRSLERLAEDRSIAAIVVRVDSNGGTMVATDRIAEAVHDARKRKPVVVSVGVEATGGGYVIASAADEIFVSPASVTGGIAPVFGRLDGERFGPTEREPLASRLAMALRTMLDRVAAGRELGEGARDRLGAGNLHSGDEAVRIGLADHLGGFASALARARVLGRVAPNVELAVFPRLPRGEAAPTAAPGPLERARAMATILGTLDRDTALAIAPSAFVVAR